MRNRNFALVWSAGLISNVGTWMETVAVGDLVAHDTGQAGWTALVAAAGFLPMGLLGPIGGAVADRFDRRRLVIAMNGLQMVFAALLTLLAATGHTSPAMVALAVFGAGCVAGLGFPAYSAMLPDLVPEEDLLAAVSLSQAQWNLGRVVGPALAGVAIALGSYTAAFAINTLSFAAMLLALRALRLAERAPSTDEARLWARIKVGAIAAWAEPGVRSAIVLISVVALTASPFIALIPAMARVRFDGDSSLTSRFVTAQGIGAVAGAFLLPVLAARFGRYRMLRASLVALPVALVLYGAAPTALLATVALLGVGATYMFVFSSIGTVVQLRAPAELRGRVLSFYFLALGVLYPVGATLQGPIADHLGLGPVTALSGIALFAVVALIGVVRPARLAALEDPIELTSPTAVAEPAGF
ncbi:MFS transporter [Aquihabitans sp. G128]|uniref:MFS transporter n=1 Tax=Aquihabitans sp. G128 TaxID=2849779 RepID=UPI001C244418|nr:MFS transporter [Aquihabitans sp. G128]QXC59505.1 MFS transporter [Aquihabitans sp. G128]